MPEKPVESRALAIVEPKAPLALIGPELREQLLTTIGQQFADEAAAEAETQGESKKTPPRILRLLKSINPELYETLRKEMEATLTLINSPATEPALKQELIGQVGSLVEQRLGPAFSHIAFAVLLVDNFLIESIGAAIEDLPASAEENHDQFVETARGMTELFALRTIGEEVIGAQVGARLRGLVVDYVVNAADECRGSGHFDYEKDTYSAAMADEDVAKFDAVVTRTCTEIGLPVRIEAAPEPYPGRTNIGEEMLVTRLVTLRFDFLNLKAPSLALARVEK